MSTFDFSTLYTRTLPNKLIKEKLTNLIEQNDNREDSLYLVCNKTLLNNLNDMIYGHVRELVTLFTIFCIIYTKQK